MSDIIKELEAATSDEDREWVVMKFSLESLDAAVQEAIWAAAVPMWFDRDFLATLLEKTTDSEFPLIFNKLLECSFVEKFPDRGYNVHERSRALLLTRLSNERHQLYLQLNKKAADYCATQDQTAVSWRVAYLYHTLLSNSEKAVQEFVDEGSKWERSFQYGILETLARPVIAEWKVNRVSPIAAAWAYYFQAVSDYMYSRFHRAKENSELAVRNSGDDKELRADALQKLGDVQLQLGEIPEAEKSISEARQIYRQLGNKHNEANCILSIGEISRYANRLEDARKSYEEAIVLYKDTADELGEANCKCGLGEVYMNSQDYDKSRVSLTEALSTFERLGIPQNIVDSLKLLGDLAVELGDYDEARQKYEQSLELSQRIGSPLAEATALTKIGRLLGLEQHFNDARAYLEKALGIYRQVGSKQGEQNCLHYLNIITESS